MADAGAIMALSPWIFASRMHALAVATPMGAALAMQRFAVEKAMAVAGSAFAASMEAMSQSASLGAAIVRQDGKTAAEATEKIAAAALKPVATRVRSNARSPNRKAGR